MGYQIIKEKIVIFSIQDWFTLLDWFSLVQYFKHKKNSTEFIFFSTILMARIANEKNLWSWFLWCLCDSFLWCLRLLYSAFECSAPWCSSPTFQSFLSQFLFLLMFWLSHIFVFWFLVFWSLLLRDFLSGFFSSCSSCLAKCKLRYSYIWSPKVTKSQK